MKLRTRPSTVTGPEPSNFTYGVPYAEMPVNRGDCDICDRGGGYCSCPTRAVLLNIGGADGRTPYAPSCGKISPQAASKSWEKLGCNMKALSPSDPAVYQYFGLAEELDIPVAIHMGTGGSGRANITVPSFNPARIDLLKGVSLTSQD